MVGFFSKRAIGAADMTAGRRKWTLLSLLRAVCSQPATVRARDIAKDANFFYGSSFELNDHGALKETVWLLLL